MMKNRNRIPLLILAACAACTSRPKNDTTPFLPEDPEARTSPYEIIDYQSKSDGVEIPFWLNSYLGNNAPDVIEATNEYQDSYVFVAQETSVSQNALLQWARGFQPELDFPQLVFSRVYKRLLANLHISPDGEYGYYFESFLKKTADAVYPQAVKRGEFWIYQRYTQADAAIPENEAGPEDNPPQNTYTWFMLFTIDKAALEKQLHEIMDSIAITKEVNRTQVASINHLRGNFFEGF
jgi:hypothetical protein